MEPGEACEPPKGGFRGCNWPKPVSQVSALLGDYLVSCKDQGGHPKSKKQLVLGVQYKAKSLWVSGFPERPPSRYCLVLPRTSSTPAPFSSSSEAESAHHPPAEQAVPVQGHMVLLRLASLPRGGRWGSGGEAKCLQAAPLQSQGPPLATKIRAYKAVIDSLLLHRIHSFVTLHAFFQSLLKGLALQDRNRPITKELRRWETTQISTLPGSS